MNYEQALKASKSNPAGVMKVLEGLEVECPECLGTGHVLVPNFDDSSKESDSSPCSCNKGKTHYSWSPQAGEWCLQKIGRQTYLYLIRVVSGKKLVVEPSTLNMLNWAEVTPIQGWEEIERVLEKAGYHLWESYSSRGRYTAGIDDREATFGDSRQEAVMEAVLELGKELE